MNTEVDTSATGSRYV